MAKYNFSDAERWAVFSVYGQHCYMCRKPINLASMHVDHIVPEALTSNTAEFQHVLKQLGLPIDFEVNDFGNWLPSCGPCNVEKGAMAFEPSLQIQVKLQLARKKAPKASQMAETTISNRKISNALIILSVASGQGNITVQELTPLVSAFVVAHPELARALKEELANLKLSLVVGKEDPVFELRLSDSSKIAVFPGPRAELIHGRFGVGFAPPATASDASYFCGHCGSRGPWNGARCMSCGHFDCGD